jgi:polar amino acid transport system substrate-binding protein
MLLTRHLVGVAVLLVACTTDMSEIDAAVRNELAPTGELRVAVPVAPAVSATFAVRDADGTLRGPTVELGRRLAQALGVPARFVAYTGSGAVTTASSRDEWDVTFVPIDAARAEIIDFGPAYAEFDSAFLVRAGLDVATIAELDVVGRTIGAVDNTATGRAVSARLQNTTVQSVAGVAEMRDLLAAGRLDAIALSRVSLTTLAEDVPGSRILDEALHTTATAVAVPKGRAAALGFVSHFVEEAKASGLARQVLDDVGLGAVRVAPSAGH